MKPKLTIDPVAIDAFEDSYRLLGKRTRDIPRLATFRVEAIRRFHRLGEFNLAIAVFNALLATGPHPPFQWLA